MPTNIEQQLVSTRHRTTYCQIDLLDANDKKIDELSGIIISGSLHISNSTNSSGNIRRSCNLEMILNDDLLPETGNKITLNRKVRVSMGIQDNITSDSGLFNVGLFVISNPKLQYSTQNRTLSLELFDLMCLYNGTLGGTLKDKILLSAGTPLSEAIKAVVSQKGKITKFKIENMNYTLFCDIKKDEGSNISEIVKELVDLYKGYDFYFDENGWFIFEKIKDYKTDFPIEVYDDSDLITDYSLDTSSENVKNHIIVLGGVTSDGSQVKSEIKNEIINHPYNIVTIGDKVLIENKDKLYTQDQVDSYANYLLEIHSNTNDKLSIQIIPNYLLNVNRVVEITKEEIGIEASRWLIDDISVGLKFDSLMSLTLHKLYD